MSGAAWLLLVPAIALGLSIGSLLRSRVTVTPPSEPPPETAAAITVDPPAAPPQPRIIQTGTTPLWPLRVDRGPEEPHEIVHALGLRRAGETATLWLLPLEKLPVRGELRTHDGASLAVQVVTWSADLGHVLFTATAPAKQMAFEPRASSTVAEDEALVVLTPTETGAERREGRHVIGRNRGGLRLTLDADAAAGSIVLDAQGRVVAYCLGGQAALPLDSALFWLGFPGQLLLADAQKQIRSADPVHLLHDAEQLLARDGPVSQAREAIELLENALHLVRDRELLDEIEKALKHAYLRAMQGLTRSDPRAALDHAQAALSKYPTDARLLQAAASLELRCGTPLRALAHLRVLLSGAIGVVEGSPTAAIVDDFLREYLAGVDRTWISGSRSHSLQAMRSLIEVLPRVARLRARFASLLLEEGDASSAYAEASEAALLDPAYETLAGEIFAATQRSRTGTIEIPYDSATGAIRANVSAGGHAVRYLVDTGASMTTVPSSVADALGLRDLKNRRVKVNTASGIVEGEVVQLPWLDLGSLRIPKVHAVVLDLPGDLHGMGLLGMNVLGRLNLQIDSATGRLILRPHGARNR
jgi:aspartyl protease family protein